MNPTVTVKNLNENELKALDKMFYKLPEDAKVTIGNGVVIVPGGEDHGSGESGLLL